MLQVIVILAWLSLIPAGLYWLRALPPVRAFIAGFLFIWHSLLTATSQEDLYDPQLDEHDQAGVIGVLAAFASVIIVLLALLVFAIGTIYWAG